MPNLLIEKCREDAVIPTYAHEGDAGMDLYAAEDVIIAPGTSVLVPTGLKMAIPVGYEVQIRARSGPLNRRQNIVILQLQLWK